MGQAPTRQQVQSELGARIGLMGTRITGAGVRDLAAEIDSIRRVAFANGLFPAVAVAQALEAALAHGERGPLIQGWLWVLRDALGCDRQDARACETFAAACSVRFSS